MINKIINNFSNSFAIVFRIFVLFFLEYTKIQNEGNLFCFFLILYLNNTYKLNILPKLFFFYKIARTSFIIFIRLETYSYPDCLIFCIYI